MSQITLGNTGFSFDIPKSAEEADPVQPGKKKSYKGWIEDNYVSFDVFYPVLGRGPAFSWDWVEEKEGGYTREDAIFAEDGLYSLHNDGLLEDVTEELLGFQLCRDTSLRYLVGTTSHSDKFSTVSYANNGSQARVGNKRLVPIFAIDSLMELRKHGSRIITNDCYVLNHGHMYRVCQSEIMEHHAHYLKKGKFRISFLKALRFVSRKKFEAHALRRSSCPGLCTFKDHHDQTITVRRASSNSWMWNDNRALGTNTYFFFHGGVNYTYVASVEATATARETLVRHNL